MKEIGQIIAVAGSLIGGSLGPPALADDADRVVRIDHYVGVRSTVPAISGQMTSIYVREVVRVGTALRDGANRVVLFVHGNGTPGEVAFDVPYRDYSWMEFLARAGFDVFAMDMTGYGRSTRPTAMNDPCNLASEQQLVLAPGHSEACTPSYGQEMTTIASDWNDIGAVVDHLLALRHVSQVSLVAWSLGGPRAGGYAAQHPEKVQKLVFLAPGYNERNAADKPPAQVPAAGAALNTQSRDDFTALWNRQVGCPAQYEQAAFDAIWSAMIESDPVGATWGSGVPRAPEVTRWGWNASVVAATRIPTLMVTGAHDKEVLPERVYDLYANLGATRKVLIDLACSSHYALWEKNHLLLFQGSLEWLTNGTVNGMEQGIVRFGY